MKDNETIEIPTPNTIDDLKKMLEDTYNGKLILYENLPIDIKNWLFRIIKRKESHKVLLCFDVNSNGYRILFYTNSYKYSITFNKDKNYMGCVSNRRKQNAGEHWTRGSDLPDGIYGDDTWNEILRAIVSNELVELQLGY